MVGLSTFSTWKNKTISASNEKVEAKGVDKHLKCRSRSFFVEQCPLLDVWLHDRRKYCTMVTRLVFFDLIIPCTLRRKWEV